MVPLAFVILRHVGCGEQNIYWNIAYKCIRGFYPETPIVIIDDHSLATPKFLGEYLYKTSVIQSTLPPNRGELLPYYYLYTRRFAQNAVFIHDTVFLNSRLEPRHLFTRSYHFLWSIRENPDHTAGFIERRAAILSRLDNRNEIRRFYADSSNFDVCFGGMVMINVDFLTQLFARNNHLQVLVDEVNSRKARQVFEVVIGLLLCMQKRTEILYGDVCVDQDWSQTLKDCTEHLMSGNKRRTWYKVWLGRQGFVKEAQTKKMGKANLLMKGSQRPVRKYKIWTSR